LRGAARPESPATTSTPTTASEAGKLHENEFSHAVVGAAIEVITRWLMVEG